MSHVSLPLPLAPNYDDLVLARDTTDPNVIELMAQHYNHGVAKLAAANPHCPSHVLIKLASHSSKSVREAVAEHLNTPAEYLRLLAHDPAVRVRENAVQNPVLVN